MLRIAFVSLLLFSFTLSPASAASCPPGSDPVVAPIGPFYVTATPGIWQESNNVAGLQSVGGTCVTDDGRDFTWVADTQIA